MEKVTNKIQLAANVKQIKKESLDFLCTDPMIKTFMENHHLLRHDVDEFWIELLNYHEDYHLCKGCKQIDTCPKNMKGYQRILKYENGRISLDMQPCIYEKEHANHLHVLNSIIPCNMPKDIFNIPFKDLEIKDRESVLSSLVEHATSKQTKGVYLHGKMQNGKTTIMASYIYRLAQNGKNCAFMNVPTLVSMMKEQFSTSNSNLDLMYQLKVVEILVLDDIGSESITPWVRDEVISSIIYDRALRNLPTYFTSVYSLEELKKIYSISNKSQDKIKAERLIEKMKAVCVSMELKSSKIS